MQVTIDRMEAADLEDVIRIERQSFPTPWRAETFRYEVAGNDNACYVVARAHLPEGRRVIGYAGMWLVADEAHITTIAVDPAYRGLKIGERLLVSILDAAIRQGMLRATLEVRESNRVAQKLYVKYRFDAVGMRRHYYSDTGENAIIMWIENLRDPAFQRIFRANRRLLQEDSRALARH
ncbi:MAG: ribosomal protein S18-alanine N-acetyltransferase [Armatimonadetes bacterium]|nr:ribosomal protein S18-alanine N-acetyltransferase [Armatimonadota bacterium]